MRWAAGVMALLFAVALVLQYNDPDPALWMTIYGAAAAVSAAAALGLHAVHAAAILFAALAAGAVYLAPALRALRLESFTGASAGSLADEEVRETLGMMIVAAWTFALWMWLRRRTTERGNRALFVALALIAAAVLPLALHWERRLTAPRVLLDGLKSPAVVVASGSNLVVSVFEGNKTNLRTLLRVPLDGGAPLRLASGQMGLPSIALDETDVYWTSYLEGTLSKVPLAGGAATLLASGLVRPFGLGVRGADVYFTTRRGGHRSLMKVSKHGGEPLVIVEDQGGVHSVRVTPSAVFWTTEEAVVKVTSPGAAPVVLAKGRKRPTALDVADGFVYYAVSGAIERVPAGGGSAEVLARVPGRVVALGVDADTVYAASGRPGGALMKLPARGGAVVPVAAVPEGITGLGFAPESVVVTTDATPGRLLAVPR